MAREETPYRTILLELTDAANSAELDPYEAHVELRQHMGLRGLQLDAYGSSSITSGGHARNNDLQFSDVIARNTDTALDMCDELYKSKQLDPMSTIEAVTLGKVRHWSQSDYMTFWLATMAGLRWSGHGIAREIDDFRLKFDQLCAENEDLDMGVYNDSTLEAKQRVSHYFEHANVFARSVQGSETEPVKKIAQLVDPDTSLGAQTERVFAKLIGAQVFRVALARTGLTPTSDFVKQRLVADSSSIVVFGGTVFDARQRKIAVLVPAEE